MAPPVHLAAYEDDMATLVELLCQKPDLAFSRDIQGQTPLHHAAYQGHVRCIEYLLTRPGVSIDETGPSRCTALWLASYNGQVDAVRILLLKGADPTICSADGRSPSEIAKNAWWHGQGRIIYRMIQTLGFFKEPEDLPMEEDDMIPLFDSLEEELTKLADEREGIIRHGPLLLTC